MTCRGLRIRDDLAIAVWPAPRKWVPVTARTTRWIGCAGLLAALVCGGSSAHAACEVDTPEVTVTECEASYREEVRKRLGDVGIVLTPKEESVLMALQRDQWAEAKATTTWKPKAIGQRVADVEARPVPPRKNMKRSRPEGQPVRSVVDPR